MVEGLEHAPDPISRAQLLMIQAVSARLWQGSEPFGQGTEPDPVPIDARIAAVNEALEIGRSNELPDLIDDATNGLVILHGIASDYATVLELVASAVAHVDRAPSAAAQADMLRTAAVHTIHIEAAVRERPRARPTRSCPIRRRRAAPTHARALPDHRRAVPSRPLGRALGRRRRTRRRVRARTGVRLPVRPRRPCHRCNRRCPPRRPEAMPHPGAARARPQRRSCNRERVAVSTRHRARRRCRCDPVVGPEGERRPPLWPSTRSRSARSGPRAVRVDRHRHRDR